MFRTIRRVLRIILLLIAGLWLHYVLPQKDVARITSTEVIRFDPGRFNSLFYSQGDSGNATTENRDLRLINTVRRKTALFGLIRYGEGVMVYRNEDTGWIYPPYFKFDSSNLQAEADDAKSTRDDPRWYVITHYGWRIPFLSIYPNAVSIKPVDGPDYRPIPWFNIVFLIALAAGLLFVRTMWRQFRERTIDPAIDKVEDRIDRTRADVSETGARWFGRRRK